MKNSRFLLAFTAILLCVCSCKKKDNDAQVDPPLPPIAYPDYTMLKPGNYWIYQDYILDSANGPARAISTFDSTFVEKDTVINGKTYHKYWDFAFLGPGSNSRLPVATFLRDSLSFLVNASGGIQFSSTDFNSIFYTAYGIDHSSGDSVKVTYQMGFRNATTVTGAGTFATSAYRNVYYFLTGPSQGRSVEYDYRYSEGVGLVSYTTGVFSSKPEVYERRLIRYHLH